MKQNINLRNINHTGKYGFQSLRIKKIFIRLVIPVSFLSGLGYLGTKILAAPSILSNNNINIQSDNSNNNSNNNLKDSNNVKISQSAHYSNKTLPITKTTDDHTTIISSTNQSGGITAQTVNVTQQTQQPRHLNQLFEKDLISKLPRNASIKVTAVMGDQEAFAFAMEISQFLRDNQYNIEGPNLAVFNKPVEGGFVRQNTPDNYDIIIGSNQNLS